MYLEHMSAPAAKPKPAPEPKDKEEKKKTETKAEKEKREAAEREREACAAREKRRRCWRVWAVTFAVNYGKVYAAWLFAMIAMARVAGVVKLDCSPFWQPVLLVAVVVTVIQWLQNHPDCREGSVSEYRSMRIEQYTYAQKLRSVLLVLTTIWVVEATVVAMICNRKVVEVAQKQGVSVADLLKREEAKLEGGDRQLIKLIRNMRPRKGEEDALDWLQKKYLDPAAELVTGQPSQP